MFSFRLSAKIFLNYHSNDKVIENNNSNKKFWHMTRKSIPTSGAFFARNQHPYGLACGSAGKESACNAGDLGSIPGLGRSPGEGKGYQYSGLENSMDCIVHRVSKS